MKKSLKPITHIEVIQPLYKDEISTLENFLQKKEQTHPYQFAMTALFNLINENSIVNYAGEYQNFIQELRSFLLSAENEEKFLEKSVLSREGLVEYLKSLELFFIKMQQTSEGADIEKFGLSFYPDRYQADVERGSVQNFISKTFKL